jgi:succinyl-CoA synthetase beta subunit
VRQHIEPNEDFSEAQASSLVAEAGVDEDAREKTVEMMVKLHDAFNESDATLIEVNPMVVTKDRNVIALDSKVTIDNSALFRHEDLADLEESFIEDPQERMAKEKGLTYVKLDGDIGILGNGAGLCMSTLDVVAQAGGKPANFLDAGGGSKAEAIVDALEVITSDEKVRAVLFNIFGGITRGDEIANGIIEASQRVEIGVPLVVRLDGTNSEEGLALLADADLPDLHVEKTMLGAAEKVVALAKATAGAPGRAAEEAPS